MENETILAIVSIILGAVGIAIPIFTLFIPCFAAIIIGFIAYAKEKNLGLIGVILGIVGVIINGLMVAYIIPPFYGLLG